MFDEFISFVRTKKRGMVRYSAYGPLVYIMLYIPVLNQQTRIVRYGTVWYGTLDISVKNQQNRYGTVR